MHGRVKSKINKDDELNEKKEEQEKALILIDGFRDIIAKKNCVESYNEVLENSSNLLVLNPDVYTLWNIRRTIMLEKQKLLATEEFKNLCAQENQLVEKCLAINPKSYSAWHQRGWIMSHMPDPDWKRELALCSKFLSFDERNFHCWDHRRFVAKESKVSIDSELQYTLQKINQNFSNYSAWHYRSTLWEEMLDTNQSYNHDINNEKIGDGVEISSFPNAPTQPRDKMVDHILTTDKSLVTNATFTDPFDQSAWFYLRWLLTLYTTTKNFSKVDAHDRKMSTISSTLHILPKPGEVGSQNFDGNEELSTHKLADQFLLKSDPNSSTQLENYESKMNTGKNPIPVTGLRPSRDNPYAGWLKEGEVGEEEADKNSEVSGNKNVGLDIAPANLVAMVTNRSQPAFLIFVLDTCVQRAIYASTLPEVIKLSQEWRGDISSKSSTFYFYLELNGTIYPSETLKVIPLHVGNFNGGDNTNYGRPCNTWMVKNLNSDWTSLVGEKFSFRLIAFKPGSSAHATSLTCTLETDRPDSSIIIPNYRSKQNIEIVGERVTKSRQLLADQLSICRQLNELEPKNKWSLLTGIWIGEKLEEISNNEPGIASAFTEGEMLGWIEKLISIDQDRKGYYQYLRSKAILKPKLISLTTKLFQPSPTQHSLNSSLQVKSFDVWDDTDSAFDLQVSRVGLTDLIIPAQFKVPAMLISTVDVSFNNLTCLKWCKQLCCLKRLVADDNQIASCDGMDACLLLTHLSLKNNEIKAIEPSLLALNKCSNLKSLILRGNPVCYTPHFPEDLYASCPSTLGLLKDYSDSED